MGVDFQNGTSMSYPRFNDCVRSIRSYFKATENPEPPPKEEDVPVSMFPSREPKYKYWLFPETVPVVIQNFCNYPYDYIDYDNGDLQEIYTILSNPNVRRGILLSKGCFTDKDTLKQLIDVFEDCLIWEVSYYAY